MVSISRSTEPLRQIRVLIADDKEVFREGLARLLEEQNAIEVVCQCDSECVTAKVQQTKPDLILMDAELSSFDATKFVSQIRESFPDIKVAMLTDCVDKEKLFSCLESGARGYLIKNLSIQDLVESINLIAKGRVVISPLLAEDFLDELAALRGVMKSSGVQGQYGLTDREAEILGLIGMGYSNKEIAQKLIIAENTVKVHVKNILNKLGLRNRQHAAAYAAEHNLIPTLANVWGKGNGAVAATD
jgi:DNA-binding NarL/FixJ family response regulator